MCGRFVQLMKARRKARALAKAMAEQAAAAARAESWNVAPSTSALVVRSEGNALSADWFFWGLQNEVPLSGVRPTNARLESAFDKPTFRDAWLNRRCVVPVEGWYEWKTDGNDKQPYYFSRRDGEPIFLGGLWAGRTFCLLTTRADGDLAKIHERRPLALRDADAETWITGPPASPERLAFSAVPPIEITFHPVSPRVNNARTDGPSLINPIVLDDTPRPIQTSLF